jgi:signal transduction histidine kinase
MSSDNKAETLSIATILALIASYTIIYSIIFITGGIHSVHLVMLYLPILAGFLTGRHIGRYMVLINIGVLVLINYYTDDAANNKVAIRPGNEEYALLFHCSITVLIGLMFSFSRKWRKPQKSADSGEQSTEVILLNKIIEKKTQELQDIKQNFSNYFHDETGNILAAITQQASVLKMKLGNEHPLLPVVKNISANCDRLYSASKDFLWIINNNSSNPMELFSYLIAYGQLFFNQYEMAFSAQPLNKSYYYLAQMPPFAVKDLIAIFKTAMTNTAEYSGAQNAMLGMTMHNGHIRITLQDNGNKEKFDPDNFRAGVRTIEERCKKSNFRLLFKSDAAGNYMEVEVPVSISVPPSRLTGRI